MATGTAAGGCCAAVSRGRLTGPQSCEALSTFRGAEPDYVEFLRTHAPPQFGGHVGMTQQQFQAAGQRWSAAMKAYEKQVRVFSTARTDCVGVTIDEFEQGRAVGRKIKLVCPPRKRP
jgi:hypothetical protein